MRATIAFPKADLKMPFHTASAHAPVQAATPPVGMSGKDEKPVVRSRSGRNRFWE